MSYNIYNSQYTLCHLPYLYMQKNYGAVVQSIAGLSIIKVSTLAPGGFGAVFIAKERKHNCEHRDIGDLFHKFMVEIAAFGEGSKGFRNQVVT